MYLPEAAAVTRLKDVHSTDANPQHEDGGSRISGQRRSRSVHTREPPQDAQQYGQERRQEPQSTLTHTAQALPYFAIVSVNCMIV